MSLELDVQIDEAFAAQVDEGILRRVVEETLRAEGVTGPVELGLLVVDDARIQALNHQYLGRDWPTDVIAFGLEGGDPGFATPPDGVRYLGDVVVSYPRAVEQAAEQGYAERPAWELSCLVVHGVLHLLGYDDQTAAGRDDMMRRMAAIVATIHGEPTALSTEPRR